MRPDMANQFVENGRRRPSPPSVPRPRPVPTNTAARPQPRESPRTPGTASRRLARTRSGRRPFLPNRVRVAPGNRTEQLRHPRAAPPPLNHLLVQAPPLALLTWQIPANVATPSGGGGCPVTPGPVEVDTTTPPPASTSGLRPRT